MHVYQTIVDWSLSDKSRAAQVQDMAPAELYEMGVEYLNSGIYNEACICFGHVVKPLIEINDEKKLAPAHLGKSANVLFALSQGLMYMENQSYFSAAEYYLAAYQILHRLPQAQKQTWSVDHIAYLPELYMRAILLSCGKEYNGPPDASLTDIIQDCINNSGQKPPISTVLAYVRLLAISDERLLDGRASAKMVEALIDRYGKAVSASQRDQSYEVLNKVAELYNNMSDGLGKRIAQLVGAADLSQIQQQRGKIIAQLVRWKELFSFEEEAQLIETMPQLLGKTIDECLLIDPAKRLDIRSVSEVYNSFILRIKKTPCYLGCCLLAPISEALRNTAIKHLGKEFAGRVAVIDIPPLNKQYKIDSPTDSITIDIPVYNRRGSADALSFQLVVVPENPCSDHVQILRVSPDSANVPVDIKPTIFQCEIEITKGVEKLGLGYLMQWQNISGEESILNGVIEVSAQRTDVCWQDAAENNPYILDWISDKARLLGRGEHLRTLFDDLSGMISRYITGQKRVGKTSVARVFESELVPSGKYPNVLPVFLEWGEVAGMDPGYIAQQLFVRLRSRYMQKFGQPCPVDLPPQEYFCGKLAPLTTLLEELHMYRPDIKLVLIVDEFDEIPPEFYRKGNPSSDEFFLALRAIINRRDVSIILIGGERLPFIFGEQGEKLNKVSPLTVDYFDSVSTYKDFEALVRIPAQGTLDYHDDAVKTIFEFTAGNPYFTNVLCGAIYRQMVAERDSYVSPRDVQRVALEVSRREGINVFKHFWDDGIDLLGEEREAIAYMNAQALMMLALSAEDHKEYVSRSIIVDHMRKLQIDPESIENRLSQLQYRKVLEVSAEKEIPHYRIKVGLFHQWLREKGINEIRTSYQHTTGRTIVRTRAETTKVRDDEVQKQARRFGIYQGIPITPTDVRVWLSQFGEAYRQRLAFKLLESIKFYPESDIRQKCREIFRHIIEDAGSRGHAVTMTTTKASVGRRKNVFITHVDAVGKSGSVMAKLIQEENRILASNLVTLDRLSVLIREWDKEQSPPIVVFVNDFIGTGGQASKDVYKALELLSKQCKDIVNKASIYYAAIVGFTDGIDKVSETGVRVVVSDRLDDGRCAFSRDANIFDDDDDRRTARDMCERIGRAIASPDHALGHEQSEGLIVFYDNTPNNTLPVFHGSGNFEDKVWTPLFPRK